MVKLYSNKQRPPKPSTWHNENQPNICTITPHFVFRDLSGKNEFSFKYKMQNRQQRSLRSDKVRFMTSIFTKTVQFTDISTAIITIHSSDWRTMPFTSTHSNYL